ncbi:ABC transporter substrate-binding protein [Saccharobesus litoralis]|uniref:ABC transporter substrate-binding protein n=1 Tax=Saccharobesus litoralis TaxID=2172099 RepID=A0A2S0VUX3_9ALTE|nr:TRAP transporter substrate-binding protein [Saccharobesus litoralis]AWB68021.1 ABC transporter substrate-binding protein [Saccharobesus litoralis]
MKKYCLALVTGLSLLLAACGGNDTAETGAAPAAKKFKWKLVTSWPKNFPGLGHGPELFAQYVNEMSGGRLTIKVYGAGELVPAFGVFDGVRNGAAEMGHSGSYFWKGKIPASPFFSSIPFGMNAQELNAWIHYGDGLALWRELYKPFGLVPYAGGNTGVQMAGWFNKEINSLQDIQGLKMRIPGFAGDVFKKAGGVPTTLPGGELFTALQTGTIDATEWVGPYNDLAFGFHKAAKYYYTTPWHEPGSMLEFIINEKALAALPKDLQKIIEVAARAVNSDMLSEYTARNQEALQTLTKQHGVEVRQLPADVVAAYKRYSQQVIDELVATDKTADKIYQSYSAFYQKVKQYNQLSEQAYYASRDLN